MFISIFAFAKYIFEIFFCDCTVFDVTLQMENLQTMNYRYFSYPAIYKTENAEGLIRFKKCFHASASLYNYETQRPMLEVVFVRKYRTFVIFIRSVSCAGLSY